MKNNCILAGVIYIFLGGIQSVSATSIFYDVSHIAGNTWEYTYTVSNDTLGIDIDEFTVYFDFDRFQNLGSVSAPASWDPLVVEPNNFLNNDGFYDAGADSEPRF